MQSYDMDALVELIRSVKTLVQDERSIASRVEKGEFDYATEVDFKVQKYLQQALKQRYPTHQFMGEEEACDGLSLDQPTWILDPIDGTTNLIHHYPQCAISLGLMVDREIVLGIVYNPFLDHLFTAQKGKGVQLGGKPIAVSDIASLHESLIGVGTSPYTKQYARHDFEVARALFEHCQDIRRSGSAALELSYVACGIVEGFYERTLKPWDYAAGLLIVEEAGGCVTTLDGAKIPIGQASSCLATNGHVHEQVLNYTRQLQL